MKIIFSKFEIAKDITYNNGTEYKAEEYKKFQMSGKSDKNLQKPHP